MNTRRQFLITAPLGALASAVACGNDMQTVPGSSGAPATPGAPPASARRRSGPQVSPATFAEAEKLVQVTMTPPSARWPRRPGRDRWRRCSSGASGRARSRSSRRSLRRRAGTRSLAGAKPGPTRDRFVRSAADASPLAGKRRRHRLRAGHPAVALDRRRQLTSERLTQHLSRRIEQFDPKLRCVITLTREPRARASAARPTRRSRRGSIAARCTASRAA